MADNVHITRINDTDANIRANADAAQSGIETDNWRYFFIDNPAANAFYCMPNYSKDLSTGATTYLDGVYDDLNIHGTSNGLQVAKFIRHLDDTNTYIEFHDDEDRIRMVVGGVYVLDSVESSTDYTSIYTDQIYINRSDVYMAVGYTPQFHTEQLGVMGAEEPQFIIGRTAETYSWFALANDGTLKTNGPIQIGNYDYQDSDGDYYNPGEVDGKITLIDSNSGTACYIENTGSDPYDLLIYSNSNSVDVNLFNNASDGDVQKLKINGWASGGTKDTLEISVGNNIDQYADFAGCPGYHFDDEIYIGASAGTMLRFVEGGDDEASMSLDAAGLFKITSADGMELESASGTVTIDADAVSIDGANDVTIYSSDSNDVKLQSRESGSPYDAIVVSGGTNQDVTIHSTAENDHRLAFYGATPVTQNFHIPDPSGGATTDTEARTAINNILDLLGNYGLMVSS